MWSSEVLTLLRPAGEICKGPIDEAYDAWKEADAAAQALQRDVSRAWDRYDTGSGEAPARQQLLELASRRHAAAEKLAQAIELLHQAGHIQPSRSTRTPRRARGGVSAQQAAA
jgi:hypothetical protein